jgi:hypothetical protein
VVDRIDVMLGPDAPPEVPSEQHRLPVAVNGLVSFKTGDAPGPHTIRLAMVAPSGKETPNVFEKTVDFPNAPYAGVNVRLETVILLKTTGGMFRMKVYLDGAFMTQVPLQIEAQRASALPTTAQVERD